MHRHAYQRKLFGKPAFPEICRLFIYTFNNFFHHTILYICHEMKILRYLYDLTNRILMLFLAYYTILLFSSSEVKTTIRLIIRFWRY